LDRILDVHYLRQRAVNILGITLEINLTECSEVVNIDT